jgi:uncharacterized protein
VRRAVVTGASSGIGAAFARALAARGDAVVVTGRDERRLAAVRDGLPGPARLLVADLADAGGLRAAEELLRDEPVDLLVNCAGVGWHGPVAEQDPDRMAATIAVNATAPVRLTRAVLPGMLARGRGGVVNVSSVAGGSAAPGMAAYAATKAFLDSWSATLAAELAGTGVVVTAVQPGYTATAFHDRSGEDLGHLAPGAWLSPDEVAQRALAAHDRGRTTLLVVPEPALLPRVVRSARAALVHRAPWLRAAARTVRARRTAR